MARNLVKRLWQQFLQLNIYRKPFDDQPSSLKDLIATRIYVCMLAIFTLIIVLFAAFFARTITSVEYSPSSTRFAKLLHEYPGTLHCPCSKFSINYETFITVEIHFHQVCSSQFIEQESIDKMFAQHNQFSSSPDDSRITLTMFWQIISSFCSISNTTWSNIIIDFQSSYIINPTPIAKQSVQSQVREKLNYEKTLSQTTLTRNLHLLQRITNGNQFVSGIPTNFKLSYTNHSNQPKMVPKKYDNCSCLTIDGCPHAATLKDINGQIVTIPGMIADCLIINSALASTLECYYNKTCISLLHETLADDIQPLSINLNRQFTINSTLQRLFDEIMTDEFIVDVNFDQYYLECNPSYCAYSYTRRFDLIFVFTTIIGLIGTLSMILLLISPIIASIYLRRQNANTSDITTIQMSIHDSFVIRFMNRIRQSIITLNLFEGRSSRTSINISREQIFTRCYIILMIIAILIIAFYTFLQKQNQTITISNPSLDTYYQLYNDHSDTLKCPCSNLFVSYKKFLDMSMSLHKICSSDFISSVWLDYLALFDPSLVPSWTETEYSRDFRVFGVSYFQLLNAFCSLANENIQSVEEKFLNGQLISDYVPSPLQFFQETQIIIDLFVNSTKNNFARDYEWISFAFDSSFFLSGTNINFYATLDDDNNQTIIITPMVISILHSISAEQLILSGICTCGTGLLALSCSIIPLLYTNGSNIKEFDQIFWEMPISCLPILALSVATTDWWYNENYLQNIKNTYAAVLNHLPSIDIRPLNQSISSQFSNPTIQSLLSLMFIEEWTFNNSHFDRFYYECAPISCSYTIYERRPIIVVLLLIIAMCGGLSKGLRLVVKFLGKSIFIIINIWQTQNRNENDRFQHRIQKIFRTITNLNLFETAEQNELIKNRQKLYTRVYLIAFSLSLSIILFYTALNERAVVKSHSISSLDDYEYLFDHYKNDLNCPCSQISITYDDFVTELYVDKFYQGCFPHHLAYTLFDNVGTLEYERYANPQDFRYSRDRIIDSVAMLCSLADNSIQISIQTFLSSAIISNRVIPRSNFEIEINETLNLFQKKIPIAFTQTLSLIRTIMHGNALVTLISPNWNYMIAEKDQEGNAIFLASPAIYTDIKTNRTCSCATSQTCSMPAQFFDDNGTLYFTLKSFVLGCRTIETALLSSLSCLYSIECINEFRQAYYTLTDGPGDYDRPPFMTFNSETTRFNVNDTIETLVSEMFIESWTTNISYERYFNSCAPISCTYTYYYRFDFFDLLTTFLSVSSGLSIGLRLLIPRLVHIVIKIHNRFRITPTS